MPTAYSATEVEQLQRVLETILSELSTTTPEAELYLRLRHSVITVQDADLLASVVQTLCLLVKNTSAPERVHRTLHEIRLAIERADQAGSRRLIDWERFLP